MTYILFWVFTTSTAYQHILSFIFHADLKAIFIFILIFILIIIIFGPSVIGILGFIIRLALKCFTSMHNKNIYILFILILKSLLSQNNLLSLQKLNLIFCLLG